MAPPIAGDLTYQYLTTNRRTDRPLAVLLDRALARPACGPLPNTVVCLCLSCDSLSAVDRTGREPAHAPCVHSFDLTKLDSPPRVRVSRRANTPSWLHRRRLTGRLWNIISCLTGSSTHSLTSNIGFGAQVLFTTAKFRTAPEPEPGDGDGRRVESGAVHAGVSRRYSWRAVQVPQQERTVADGMLLQAHLAM